MVVGIGQSGRDYDAVDMSARSGTPGAIGFLKDFDDGPASAPTIVSAA